MSEAKPYRYFDTPAGEDVFKKLWCVVKPVSQWAVGFGIIDVMLVSHPKGYLPTIGRMAYVGAPILGSAATFVCTSNALASIRKKDDKINWFLSGFLSGSVFGMWRRSVVLGINLGLFFGLLATIRKDTLEKGLVIFPQYQKSIEMNAWDFDWTLTKERPKGYVTSKQ